MIMKCFLACAALMAALSPAAGAVAGGTTAPGAIPGIPQLGGQLNRRLGVLGLEGRSSGAAATIGVVGTDFSATGRKVYETAGAISLLKICNGQHGASASGSEAGSGAAEIVRATVEVNGTIYSATPPVPVGAQGGLDMIVPGQANSPQSCFDPVGVYIPPLTQFWVREFLRVPQPPASPAAAVTTTTLGTLSPSTTYSYVFTTVDTGLESGPTAYQSCTTGSSLTLACALSWTPNKYAQATNVYRGASTSGPFYYLTQVTGSQSSLTDVGAITPNASVTPPAQSAIVLNTVLRVGDSANVQENAGTGTDQTQAAGQISGFAGNANSYMPAPSLLLADDAQTPAILGLGDSIQYGVGIGSESGQYSANFSNWFDQGFADGQFNSDNVSIGGTKISGILTGGQLAWGRMLSTLYGHYVVTDLGINDFSAGVNWQVVANDHIALAKQLWSRGNRYIVTTLVPNVTTSDSMLTIGGQTKSGDETNRVSYNNWVRASMPVLAAGNITGSISAATLTVSADSGATLAVGTPIYCPNCVANTYITALGSGTGGVGTYTVSNAQSVASATFTAGPTPVAPGTAGAVPAPYIWNWFDLAAPLEVNSSNVLTPNGGYWAANLAAAYTGTVTGSPSVTSIPCSACALPAQGASNAGLMGYTLKMTSGAANGQTAKVKINTATTITLYAPGTVPTGLTISGLTTAPSAGDTFSLTPTVGFDGTHPAYLGHTSYLGPAWAAWVAAHIAPFGSIGPTSSALEPVNDNWSRLWDLAA